MVPLGLALLLPACGIRHVQRELVEPARVTTLDHRSACLKAHLRDGSLYVLQRWTVDVEAGRVRGEGTRLGPDRAVTDSGAFSFPVDSVALFETNVLKRSPATTALTVMAGVTAAVAGVCLASPKTCFGSCPTFYLSDGPDSTLQAEGFSASIAPALEATDVDALVHAHPSGRSLVLRLTNEALETHVVRYAHLLAAPRPPGGRVYLTPEGDFLPATTTLEPARCSGPEGDCRPALRALDGTERLSLADSTDLAAREVLDLECAPPPQGALGVVVTSRQTLLSTYLLYQELAWLGSRASEALAGLERGGALARERAAGVGAALGRIEVLVPDGAGGWSVAGATGETGPLAADTKVVPIPRPGAGPVRIRLRLTQGLWRLDRVGLAVLGAAVTPVRLLPVAVRRDGAPDPTARALLADTVRALVTLPGDAYEIEYRLPAHPATEELFLESRGYYLEWMRQEWLAEENPQLALRILLDPAGALRELAPSYKRLEPGMEAIFRNSRYARP